jgi:hypothetical protein
VNSLTDRYLDAFAHADPGRWHTAVHAIERLFGPAHLTRPVFLESGQVDAFAAEIPALLDLLTDLPNRLDGGDLAAFARRCGASARQTEAALRTQSVPPYPVARADIFATADGYRVLEVNTCGVGGTETGELCQAMLSVPVVSDFVAREGLGYTDPFPELCRVLRAEAERVHAPSSPRVALVNWPGESRGTRDTFRLVSILLGDAGFDCTACDVSGLSYRDGQVLADGRPLDIVCRFFFTDTIDSDDNWPIAAPLLAACEAGRVSVLAPFAADLYGSKRALALLWENLDLFTVTERSVVTRRVPWTHVLRPRIDSMAGDSVDALTYCLEHREDLVVKPGMAQGGAGVVRGELVSAPNWERTVRQGIDMAAVVQHRVVPVTEPFHEGFPPEPVSRVVNWGVYAIGGRYAGVFARAAEAGRRGIVSYDTGAHLGCCFEQRTAT